MKFPEKKQELSAENIKEINDFVEWWFSKKNGNIVFKTRENATEVLTQIYEEEGTLDNFKKLLDSKIRKRIKELEYKEINADRTAMKISTQNKKNV